MAVKMQPTNKIIVNLGLEKNGQVHKFFTQECARRMERFVPYREGTLSETVIINGQPTSNVLDDKIIYDQEYAKYVYYGLSRSGKPLNYTKTFHQLAGAYWDKKMVSVDMGKIREAVQKKFF